MPRKAADTEAIEIAQVITEAFEKIAAQKRQTDMEEAAQKVIAHLPEAIYLPRQRCRRSVYSEWMRLL